MDDIEVIMANIGIIYIITNILNGKIYIGKTKKMYGKQKFGVEGRLSQHFVNAFSESRKNECPRLYNAMRKYGKDKFVIKSLFECDLKQYDDFEIETIEAFDSTNRDVGYNIAKGGKGRSVAIVSEEVRKKISVAQETEGELNIKPYYKNDKLVGYRVKRRERGKQYQKQFTSTDNTPEKNLELAEKWLQDVINNELENNRYNKKSDLPQNINFIKHKKTKEIIGYRVDIMKDSKKYIRSFQNQTESLEDKLNKAIEYKKSILEQK